MGWILVEFSIEVKNERKIKKFYYIVGIMIIVNNFWLFIVCRKLY